MWKDSYVAVNINGSLSACSLVNRRIELTCSQRHNLNLGRSQETLANYLPNAFQDLLADNGKANLFGWSVSYRNRLRKAHSNFTWYDRRFPLTLRLALPRGLCYNCMVLTRWNICGIPNYLFHETCNEEAETCACGGRRTGPVVNTDTRYGTGRCCVFHAVDAACFTVCHFKNCYLCRNHVFIMIFVMLFISNRLLLFYTVVSFSE